MKNANEISASKAVIMAEYRLLNAVIGNPVLLESAETSEDLFVHELSRNVYRGFLRLQAQGLPVTESSLFQAVAEIDLNVSMEVIQKVMDIEADPVSNISDIVSLLQKSTNRLKAVRQLQLASDRLSDSFFNDIGEVENLIRESQEMVANLDKNLSEVIEFDEWFNIYLQDFDARLQGKIHPFIDPILDDAIPRGMMGGDIATIASSSGQGKSSYCLNLINNFINHEIPTMYFSPEMGAIDTMDRLIAMRRDIPFADIVSPTPETYKSIRDVVDAEREELKKNRFFRFCEKANISLNDIRKHIVKFQKQSGHQFVVVFIDLLTMVKEFCITSGGMNMAQGIEIAMNRLSAMAKELGVYIFGVVQMGRKADSTKVTCVDDIYLLRPSRNDIKNANAILERSRVVISLFRPAFYAAMYLDQEELEVKELMENDIIEINFLKLSNSRCGRRHALFTPETFAVVPMLDTDDKKDNESVA